MGVVDYFKASYDELTNHVTWPTWAEAQRLAILTAIFSIVFALIIYGVDTVFSGVISRYFDWVKS